MRLIIRLVSKILESKQLLTNVCVYIHVRTYGKNVSMIFRFFREYYYQQLLTELISRARRELPIEEDCCFSCCCFGFANDRFCCCWSVCSVFSQYIVYIHMYSIQIYTRVVFFVSAGAKFERLRNC